MGNACCATDQNVNQGQITSGAPSGPALRSPKQREKPPKVFQNANIDAETMKDMESARDSVLPTPREGDDRNESALGASTPINSQLAEANKTKIEMVVEERIPESDENQQQVSLASGDQQESN